MKTIVATIGGTVTIGDLLIVGYRSPRGGQSAVKCVMVERVPDKRPDGSVVIIDKGADSFDPAIPRAATLEEAAAKLADIINQGKEFMPTEYKAAVKGAQLIVHCSDLGSGVEFFTDVEGAGTETITLVEW